MIIQSKKQKRLERLFNYRRSLYEKKCYRYHRPRVSTAVKRFAFLPTRVGDHLVWNEWYYQHYILLSCSTIIGRRYLWVDSHRSRIEKRT